MPSCKRYKQLKLSIDSDSDHYEAVLLSFRLQNQTVFGILNGTIADWNFRSGSAVFLKYIPSGVLQKYALWVDQIPKKLPEIYDGISTAAAKAGYSMLEIDV